jgi:hypothetical protein
MRNELVIGHDQFYTRKSGLKFKRIGRVIFLSIQLFSQIAIVKNKYHFGLSVTIKLLWCCIPRQIDNLFLARIELTMAAARRADLAGVGEQLTAAARRPIAFFLKLIADGGAEARADVPIETCAGLIDGIGLMHATGQGPKPTTDQVAAVFRSIL